MSLQDQIPGVSMFQKPEEAIKGGSSQYGNTYMYYFSHETEDYERYGLKGSVHLEDLPYILGYPFFQNGPTIEFDAFGLKFADEERALSQVLMHYISTFVKTG
ncbi:unnamed protein product [Soboliphyme baturini]|uniref:COesterase domain-containing protein n=1 Tax=Soboliphyme baturini TaxID=241478 RepID=A0A183IDY4_9BILA|nr:unnamed protein product [Soboliphyme baturini]